MVMMYSKIVQVIWFISEQKVRKYSLNVSKCKNNSNVVTEKRQDQKRPTSYNLRGQYQGVSL